MRKTKIVCTLGPATETREALEQLIDAGANVFRLNMSHSNHEWVRRTVPIIREVAKAKSKHIAILMDTQGPAIRTGTLPAPIPLKRGDIFEITTTGETPREKYSTDSNYEGLIDDLNVGNTIIVDNGIIHMRVLEKFPKSVRCEILTDCVMGSRRHINLPGVRVNLPPLTEKDLADIAVGAEVKVDMLALSFVREASDVVELKEVLASHKCDARIVVKIEHQHAVDNLDAIIAETHAVMVARGDLGVECPMEDLPIIQRHIVKKCLAAAKPVIVATHMLESMISNPLPTRAEVSDVANAVFEETDAVMLSGESSVGKYPIDCVRILDLVARRIEKVESAGFSRDNILQSNRQKTVRAAVSLANSFSNAKLIVFTRSGRLANYASNLRPKAPIFAFTFSDESSRKLALNWGTTCITIKKDEALNDPVQLLEAAENRLREQELITSGDRLIIISDLVVADQLANSIHVHTLA